MNNARYSGLAIVLHWLIAAAIIANIALAWTWDSLPDAQVRPAIDLHKSIGLTVLGLAIMRLLWRIAHKPPELMPGLKQWEVRLAHVTHVLLYVILFAMPLTGWIMDSAYKDAAIHPLTVFGIPFPRIGFITALDPETKKMVHDSFGEAHELVAKLVYALVVLHIAGAIKHQWLDGRRELQRMWFWGRAE